MNNNSKSLATALTVLIVSLNAFGEAMAQGERLPNMVRNSIERDADRKQRGRRRENGSGKEGLTREERQEKRERRRERKERRETRPALPTLTVQETRKLLDSGDLDLGFRIARKNIKAEPKNASWYELSSLFRMHRGRLDAKDVENAQLAARMEPKNAQFMATYAIVLYFSDRQSAAHRTALAALQLDKNNKRAKVIDEISPDPSDTYMGTAFEQLPDNKRATTSDALLKTAEKAGDETDVYFVLAKFFHKNTDRKNLVKLLDIWVKNKPKSAYAYFKRGHDKQEFGKKYKLAIQDYEKALKLNPHCTMVLSKYALALTATRRYKEAIANYDLLAQVGRLTPAAHVHRGDCLMALNRFDEAATDYTASLNMLVSEKESPADRLAAIKNLKSLRRGWYKHWLIKRAQAYSKGGETKLALEDIKVALLAFPGDMMALNEREKLYRKTNQNELALKDLDTMIGMQKDVAPFYKDRAEVLKKLGRTKEAEADLKRALNLEKTGFVEPPAQDPKMDESE